MLPESQPALNIFLQCQTQWRVIAGMGGVFYQGLDYPSVLSVIQLYSAKRKKQQRLLEEVQLIEQGALLHLKQ